MSNINDFTKDKFENGFLKNLSQIINPEIKIPTISGEESITSQLPEVQKISINSLKNNNRENSFLQHSIASIIGTLDIADNAFLNSILSNSIYTENVWTLTDIDKNFADIPEKLEKALISKDDLYQLKIWHFNKHMFENLPVNSLSINRSGNFQTSYGESIDYEFNNGHYAAYNGLSYACVVRSKHPTEEGYVLHVVFRGTEFKKLPSYILNAYADMEAYFESFSPFNIAIKEYINNPENKIKEVQVAGHSLGGAMVQKFLQLYSPEKLPPVGGYTFGSPGSKKHLFVKFLNLSYHLLRNQTFYWEKQDTHDERLHEFYNSNDPIPKIGLLGYQRTGIIHNVFDEVYEQSKKAKLEEMSFLEKMPMFGKLISFCKEHITNKFKVRFHNSKTYSLNLKELIEEHYDTYPNLEKLMNSKTYYYDNYNKVEFKFKNLSIKYKKEFINFYQKGYPNLNIDEINNKILQIREDVKYDFIAKQKISQK